MAGNDLKLILRDGEDIGKELDDFTEKHNITYGFVVSGRGSVKDFEIISHGSRGTIERINHKAEFEVNAMSGKVERTSDKSLSSRINVLISSSGFTPLSGELIKGKAAGRLEIGLKRVDMKKMIEA